MLAFVDHPLFNHLHAVQSPRFRTFQARQTKLLPHPRVVGINPARNDPPLIVKVPRQKDLKHFWGLKRSDREVMPNSPLSAFCLYIISALVPYIEKSLRSVTAYSRSASSSACLL